MFYYKVYDLQENFLGIVSSLDLRYYNQNNKRMLCCQENLAQYLYLNEIFYRVEMFNEESPDMIGKYPEALILRTTKEEYSKYRAEIKKKILD